MGIEINKSYSHKNEIFGCDSTQSQNVTHGLGRNFRKNKKRLDAATRTFETAAGVAAGVVRVVLLVQRRCRSHPRCRTFDRE